jgi:hypothetical protein
MHIATLAVYKINIDKSLALAELIIIIIIIIIIPVLLRLAV